MKRFEHMTVTEQRDWCLEKLSDLKIENANLKNDITILSNGNFEAEIQRKWGLTRQRVEILMILYRARGRVVEHDFIHRNMQNCGFHIAREDTLPELVKVQVCHVRRLVGKESIITVWGRGYALAPEMVAELDAMRATEIAA